jgi:hypothetical protein
LVDKNVIPASNLLEGVTIYRNQYIRSSDGMIINGTSVSGIDTVSDYIIVDSSTLYHNKRATLACYDSSRLFLGGLPGGDPQRRNLIAGTKYIRVSFIYADYKQLELLPDPSIFNPMDIGKLKSLNGTESKSTTVRNLKEIEVYSANLFDKNDVQTGYYIDSDGIWVKGISSTGLNTVSHPIKVKGNTTYYRNTNSNVVFYDDGGKMLGYVKVGYGNFTTPVNCGYCRVSMVSSDIENLFISTQAIPEYRPYSYRIKNLKQLNPNSFASIVEDAKSNSLYGDTSYKNITFEQSNNYEVMKISAPESVTARLIKYVDSLP